MVFFGCEVKGTHVYGDHTIYVGEVTEMRRNDSSAPLMFLTAGGITQPKIDWYHAWVVGREQSYLGLDMKVSISSFTFLNFSIWTK
ncbi:MAG: hypothetical protein CM1200mP22_30580 [Dehalococcoidia bacterium]|nr:MAG: hypothetical protein CM1200mP22_30580 [Dehalococcoidia bacterium]